MKVYKFRSCNKFDYLLDTIMNRRVYCSSFRLLNDPMEGMCIPYLHGPNAKLKYIEFKKQRDKCRICSFSGTYRHPLLWAHYAEGFAGIAIEIDFPYDIEALHKITYLKDFPILPVTDDELPPDPITYLTTKLNYWKHEQEYRIIIQGKNKYFMLPESTHFRILTGINIVSQSYNLICQVCDKLDIPVCKTELNYKRKSVNITTSHKP
ncbi:MAG: DUF2971 domain-containing protein [Sedimentisphaerales bacterium]|nr:DUF2971 domain-containing protein [Sedimentisphaerales bacterium]